MDKVDYIIDASDSPEGAMEHIIRMAKQEHGESVINTMIDTAATEEEANEMVIKAARRTKANKEDGNLGELYKGLKHTTVLAKPLSFLTTPITEAARAPLKWAAENIGENTSQTPPIDTGAEYDSIYPSDRAGMGLFMRDAANAFGIKSSPLVNIESEDYPKAAEFARQMTDPVNLAGAAADIGIAGGNILPSKLTSLPSGMRPKNYLPEMGIVSGVASSTEDAKSFTNKAKRFLNKDAELYSPERKININPETGRIGSIDTPDLRGMVMTNHHPTINLETAVAYVESITKDKKLLAELKKTGRIYDVARRIVAEPEKYLHQFRPEKIYDTIQGGVDKFRGKRTGQGELDYLLQSQEQMLENLPQDQYSVPSEELQIAAQAELGNMGQMEAGQRKAAEGFIENNIPVMQPDPAKLIKIQKGREARKGLNTNSRKMDFEAVDHEQTTASLKQEIANQKRALMAEYQSMPDLISNPQFREDLQWLSDIEAHISDGTDTFPKQYPQERPRPNEFYQAMADHLDQNIRQAGRPLTDSEKLDVLKDFYAQNEPSASIPSTFEDVALGPEQSWRGTPVRDGRLQKGLRNAQEVKNQKILPIINGEQNHPPMIPNQEKALLRQQTMDRIVEINDQVKNMPVTSDKMLELLSERSRLQKMYDENFDPTMPLPEHYTGWIRKQNERPAGYATQTRRLGNKLMEPAVPGEISTDVAARNMAGRAMERAGRNAEQQIMGSTDAADQIIYNSQNQKISELIDLRDLTSGNLTSSGPLDNAYIPASPKGSTGLVGAASKAMDRYIRPTGSEMLSSTMNTANKLGTKGGIMTGSAINAANEFVYSKSAVNNFQIPRSTAEAVQQKDLVSLKLKREFGEEVAKAFDSAQSQEEVASLFQGLSRQNPAAFAPSKYGAIDGIILDPIMKQKAIEDVVKNKNLPPYHAAKTMEGIINFNFTGE